MERLSSPARCNIPQTVNPSSPERFRRKITVLRFTEWVAAAMPALIFRPTPQLFEWPFLLLTRRRVNSVPYATGKVTVVLIPDGGPSVSRGADDFLSGIYVI